MNVSLRQSWCPIRDETWPAGASEGGASEAPSAKAEEPAAEPASVEGASAASVKDSASVTSELQSGSPSKQPEQPLNEAASSCS